MKNTLFTLFAALIILCGCNKTNQFKVTLNLENADNQPVYLTKHVGNQEVILDSTVFVGNNAELNATYDDPQTAYYIKFELNNNICSIDGCQGELFAFFTENQNTTISGDREAFPNWTVKGCPVMDEWEAYRQSLLPMEEQMLSLFNESTELALAGDTVKGAEIMEQIYGLMDEYNNMRLDYYRNHGDSYLTHFMLDQEKTQLDPAIVKEISDCFTTESRYSKSIQDYLNGITIP